MLRIPVWLGLGCAFSSALAHEAYLAAGAVFIAWLFLMIEAIVDVAKS